MPRYDDLTEALREGLMRIVAIAHAQGADDLLFIGTLQQSFLQVGRSRRRFTDVPQDSSTYLVLGTRDYLDVTQASTSPTMIRFLVAKQGYDAVDYWGKSGWRRFWIDLAYDLGHEDTLRSKLLWHGFSILVAVFLAYLPEIIALLR